MTVIAFPLCVPPPFGTQADQPLRVLRSDLSQRVAAINTVRKLLQGAGLEIECQDLIRDGKRPLLRLVAGDDRLRGVATFIRLDHGLVTAIVNGVDVQWPHVVRETPIATH